MKCVTLYLETNRKVELIGRYKDKLSALLVLSRYSFISGARLSIDKFIEMVEETYVPERKSWEKSKILGVYDVAGSVKAINSVKARIKKEIKEEGYEPKSTTRRINE